MSNEITEEGRASNKMVFPIFVESFFYMDSIFVPSVFNETNEVAGVYVI